MDLRLLIDDLEIGTLTWITECVQCNPYGGNREKEGNVTKKE